MKYRMLKRGEIIDPVIDQIKGGTYKEWTSLHGLMGHGVAYNHAWHKIRRPITSDANDAPAAPRER
jgi:hypothetical protein